MGTRKGIPQLKRSAKAFLRSGEAKVTRRNFVLDSPSLTMFLAYYAVHGAADNLHTCSFLGWSPREGEVCRAVQDECIRLVPSRRQSRRLCHGKPVARRFCLMLAAFTRKGSPLSLGDHVASFH